MGEKSHLGELVRIRAVEGEEAAREYARAHRDEVQTEFDALAVQVSKAMTAIVEGVQIAAAQIATAFEDMVDGLDDER